MSDPILTNDGYIVVYSDERDPTSNEPVFVDQGILTRLIWWQNQVTNNVFCCIDPTLGSMVWKKVPTSLNTSIGSTRTYSTRSSPAFSTNYTPSATKDTQVIATVRMQSTILQTCTVDVQVDDGAGSFSTIATSAISGVAIDKKEMLTFIVPANCQYKLISSATGTNTLISLKELSM